MDQADEERLAELNRRKDEYESRNSGEDRSLSDDVHENYRRNQIDDQRRREQQEEADVRREEREAQKAEIEASASRISAGRKAYRDQRDEIEASAPLIAEGRRKFREKQEVEATADYMAKGRARYREEEVARQGGTKSHILDWTLLTPHEKRAANEEIQKSAGNIAKGRQQYREKKTDDYYRNTSTGQQIFDKMLGRSPTRPKPEPKQVQPINSFLGGQAYRAKQRLDAAKNNFLQEFTRPMKAVQQGRKTRMQRQPNLVDPFAQLAAPQPRRASRTKGTQVPYGTGFLFTEGFMNPPKRSGRKTKSGGGGRRRSGDLWDFLL
jgi:hypothetical protein